MKYLFECSSCGHQWEAEFKVEDFDKVKSSTLPCPKCSSEGSYKFDPSGVQVCFVGLQWSDKNYREKKYRKARSKYMAQRQKTNNCTPKLAPNYKGERTSSWKEARQEAAADGKFSETYDHLVAAEESGS